MKWRRYIAGLSVFGFLTVGHAALELSAFAGTSDGFRFIIIDAETRANSGWLALGDTFEGHRLARFDAQGEILTLERQAGNIELPLRRETEKKPDGRQRRRLTDDAAAKPKREIPIWIDAWGNVALGGTAVSFDEIEGLFRKMAEVKAEVALLFLQAPLGARTNPERMRKTKNAILGRAQEAGLKLSSSRVIDLPPQMPSK
jgi:hypothetical protein